MRKMVGYKPHQGLPSLDEFLNEAAKGTKYFSIELTGRYRTGIQSVKVSSTRKNGAERVWRGTYKQYKELAANPGVARLELAVRELNDFLLTLPWEKDPVLVADVSFVQLKFTKSDSKVTCYLQVYTGNKDNRSAERKTGFWTSLEDVFVSVMDDVEGLVYNRIM
jgi:hypothetical protein